MSGKPKIVVIISLAYSGTTWLSLLLSSHKRTLNLGAGDILIDRLHGNPGLLCEIHGADCEFWPGFLKQRKNNQDLFQDLVQYSGKDVFVLQNPTQKLLERLGSNDSVDLCFIHIIRDGKATLASAMKHHPERVNSVYQACCAWLYRGTINMKKRISMLGKKTLLIRYEDAVSNPAGMFAEVSEWTGVDYDLSSLVFWNYQHHIPSGNVGVLNLLKKMQGKLPLSFGESEYYTNLYNAAKNGGSAIVIDDRWKNAYSEVDLAAYDWVAGKIYEEYGYPRPGYSEEAYRKFKQIYNPPDNIDDAVSSFPQWREWQRPETFIQKSCKNIIILKKLLVIYFIVFIRKLITIFKLNSGKKN